MFCEELTPKMAFSMPLILTYSLGTNSIRLYEEKGEYTHHRGERRRRRRRRRRRGRKRKKRW